MSDYKIQGIGIIPESPYCPEPVAVENKCLSEQELLDILERIEGIKIMREREELLLWRRIVGILMKIPEVKERNVHFSGAFSRPNISI